MQGRSAYNASMPEPIRLTDEQIEELRTKGLPLVVQVDGREIIVQDGEAYRRTLRLLEELDNAENARICMERLEKLESGEDRGIPAEELIQQLRNRIRHAG